MFCSSEPNSGKPEARAEGMWVARMPMEANSLSLRFGLHGRRRDG
jgi:hypothetical protein